MFCSARLTASSPSATLSRAALARCAARVARMASLARAVAQIELAKRRVTLSQRAIDLANENIKIETDRFNLGKSTNFDVLRRQEELEQARLRQSASVADYLAARAELDGLGGTLLARYRIVMP